MATKSLFDTLEREAFRKGIQARTAESQKWFRQKVKDLGKVRPHDIIKDSALVEKKRFRLGDMHMFFYDPKHRKTLPFYDNFPLAIMVDVAPKGFYGLNLHYLSYPTRAKFLDKILDYTNNKRYDEDTRFNLTYGLLKSVNKLKEFQPCFKHYLTEHVDSQIVKVEAPEWEIAIFLPTEMFKKKSKTYVWGQSKKAFA